MGCYYIHRQAEKYIHTDRYVCLHIHTNRWPVAHQDRYIRYHWCVTLSTWSNLVWILAEYVRDMIWFWIECDEVSCQTYTFLESWNLPSSTDLNGNMIFARIISSSKSTLFIFWPPLPMSDPKVPPPPPPWWTSDAVILIFVHIRQFFGSSKLAFLINSLVTVFSNQSNCRINFCHCDWPITLSLSFSVSDNSWIKIICMPNPCNNPYILLKVWYICSRNTVKSGHNRAIFLSAPYPRSKRVTFSIDKECSLLLCMQIYYFYILSSFPCLVP